MCYHKNILSIVQLPLTMSVSTTAIITKVLTRTNSVYGVGFGFRLATVIGVMVPFTYPLISQSWLLALRMRPFVPFNFYDGNKDKPPTSFSLKAPNWEAVGSEECFVGASVVENRSDTKATTES